MADTAEALGYLAVLCSALSYGSYYVPIKRHEVHDGLVYQWYQCTGILFAGIAFALLRNDWSAPPGVSTGFYVAPEGLLSGLLFQLGNVVATFSVKAIGLGGYFTIHEVTNIGVALAIGFLGSTLGLPARPPEHWGLALFGALMVGLGMLPVMFMRPAWGAEDDEPDSPPSVAAVAAAHGGGAVSPSGLDSLFQESATAAPVPGPDYRDVNTRTWDGVLGLPPTLSGQGRRTLNASGIVPTVPPLLEMDVAEGCEEPLLPESSEKPRLMGICYALLAGALYSLMFLPQLRWVRRMDEDGYSAHAVDYAFSVCVGLACTSTIWLLCGGAWKRYKGQRMEKSVLRPALFCGAMEFVGIVSQLHALVALPYAVAYCSITGGALAVSLLWGVVVFGEASGQRNRICVAISFGSIFLGVLLLGVSAH